jgi:peptidoglycan-N-acetylglucosamine deacetylase
MNKRFATISLDLDNQWSYMKIHGDEGWEKYPSYLDIFLPYVLDILDELQLKITFFIVGKDAAIKENRQYLKMITDRGHDVGNHSFNHESWLQKYQKEQIVDEIDMAEEAIISATTQKPIGFRGPGFSWSKDLLNVLYDKGYQYDASTLPTYIGPLARIYYFWKSDLSKKEKHERRELFGSFREGLRGLKPYCWDLEADRKILEIPVTTIPVFKIPFHLSYLLYLHGISPFLKRFYLNFALLMCRITGTPISFLLHPLDLIGGDQVKELAFFPGMEIKSDTKALVFKETMIRLKKRYQILTLNDFSKHYLDRKLKSKQLL